MAANPEIMEDKLQRFSRHVFEQAYAKRDAMSHSLQKQRDEALAQTRRRCALSEAAKLEKSQVDLDRLTNETLSRIQLDAKRELTLHRGEIMEKVFEDVRQKLNQFRQGPTYYPWLVSTARAALEKLGEGKREIYIGSQDAAHARALETDCGVPVKLADPSADIQGGIRAVNHTTNTVYSDTFSQRLENQKNEFLKLSGLTL